MTLKQDAKSEVKTSENKKLDAVAASCSFLTFGHYSLGLCTYYGACRVESVDYMYRGGCGELSLWGLEKIDNKNVGYHKEDMDAQLTLFPPETLQCVG